MTDSAKPVVSWTTPQTPIIDKATGQISFTWLKWFQGIQQTINGAFDQQGNFDGNLGSDASITGRAATLLVIIHNIDDTGVITANGIDFARAYLNKDTDHINDGLGSPLAGGKAAFVALVSSTPSMGEFLEYDGTKWTAKQVDFSDISGVAEISQIPDLPESQIIGLTADLAAKAPLASPNFTGTINVNGTESITATATVPLALASSSTAISAITFENSSNGSNWAIGTAGSAGFASIAPSGSFLFYDNSTGALPLYLTDATLTVRAQIAASNLALTAATTATSATTGVASALPPDPAGYLEISINGTTYKLPYYNA